MVGIAANDTGWGKTSLATGAYNYFGIKGTGDAGSVIKDTWEVINGKVVATTAKFAKYSSPAAAFAAFATLVTNPKGRYNAGGIMDPQKFMETLKAGGYATDPGWVSKIMTIIGTVRKYWPVQALATGGLVENPGLYSLAEQGPEAVLSNRQTTALMGFLGALKAPPTPSSLRGLSGGGGSTRSIVVQQTGWSFNGTFTEGDKLWFRRAAKDAAFEAVAEVFE